LARWLLKTEPGTYSFDDLMREKKTVWSGVKNPTALQHIRSMKKGDAILIYHTGNEKAAAGTATVASDPYPDPDAGDERFVVVDIKSGSRLQRPVALPEFKRDPTFKGFDLLRIGRLSVVPVPDAMWERIEQLAATQPHVRPNPTKTKPAATKTTKEARRR
jgi:predicted RNA-binding protein with PUA-like domain